jgi:hypothetical protein
MSNKTPPSDNEATIGINNDINAKIKHHNNVDQNIITITEDKTELILRDKLKELEAKKSWETPFGMFLSLIVIPLTTENFKDFLFIQAKYAEVIIHLAIVGSFVWSICGFFKSWKNRHVSIKEIIKTMKRADNEDVENTGFFKKVVEWLKSRWMKKTSNP